MGKNQMGKNQMGKNQMDKNQMAVIDLLQFELWGRPSSFDSLDWNSVFDFARQQGVILLIYDAIVNLNRLGAISISDTELLQFRNYSLACVVSGKRKIKFQKEILEALYRENIRTCVLKGTSLTINYTKPDLRPLGDLDLYVEPQYICGVRAVLENLGFEYEKSTTQYHSSFSKEGFEIEVHNSLAGMPVGTTRKKMLFLKKLSDRAVLCDNSYGKYYIPCVFDNGIIQLLHILHHTGETGMTLRILCDWMMFVNRNINDDVWYSSISEGFAEIGLDHMAKLITKLCKVKLGLNNSLITWCDDITISDIEAFWNHIIHYNAVMPNSKRKVGSFKPVAAEHILREDEWEYKSASNNNYYLEVAFRNIKRIIKGERSIKEFLYLSDIKLQTRKRFVELGLLDKKVAKDYSL